MFLLLECRLGFGLIIFVNIFTAGFVHVLVLRIRIDKNLTHFLFQQFHYFKQRFGSIPSSGLGVLVLGEAGESAYTQSINESLLFYQSMSALSLLLKK